MKNPEERIQLRTIRRIYSDAAKTWLCLKFDDFEVHIYALDSSFPWQDRISCTAEAGDVCVRVEFVSHLHIIIWCANGHCVSIMPNSFRVSIK